YLVRGERSRLRPRGPGRGGRGPVGGRGPGRGGRGPVGGEALRAVADADGQVGGKGAHRGHAAVAVGGARETAGERGADDDAVREGGALGRLGAVADAEADGHRQAGVLTSPGHQLAGARADRLPGAGDAHEAGGVDEAAAYGCYLRDPLCRGTRRYQE